MRPNTFIYKIYLIYYAGDQVEAWVRVRLHQFYSEQSHMMNDPKTNSFKVHGEEKKHNKPSVYSHQQTK